MNYKLNSWLAKEITIFIKLENQSTSTINFFSQAQLNGYNGPTLGPKEATGNPRDFTEEQLLHGRVHGI